MASFVVWKSASTRECVGTCENTGKRIGYHRVCVIVCVVHAAPLCAACVAISEFRCLFCARRGFCFDCGILEMCLWGAFVGKDAERKAERNLFQERFTIQPAEPLNLNLNLSPPTRLPRPAVTPGCFPLLASPHDSSCTIDRTVSSCTVKLKGDEAGGISLLANPSLDGSLDGLADGHPRVFSLPYDAEKPRAFGLFQFQCTISTLR